MARAARLDNPPRLRAPNRKSLKRSERRYARRGRKSHPRPERSWVRSSLQPPLCEIRPLLSADLVNPYASCKSPRGARVRPGHEPQKAQAKSTLRIARGVEMTGENLTEVSASTRNPRHLMTICEQKT